MLMDVTSTGVKIKSYKVMYDFDKKKKIISSAYRGCM